ncbi:hypothetical protein E0L21_12655 [Kosakonia quasisacchari]|uniref:Uncharacterized protein n=1 Tax=Kosakonia quasisacchari TaxID=2529380 RepID=A0A4R0H9R6_9ENTR|nr:hypothetical protein [Kosakonia quasisacchari]TCC06833.1 hypothetical protein E0L21_12655 [Kosakonia quasisacchari]
MCKGGAKRYILLLINYLHGYDFEEMSGLHRGRSDSGAGCPAMVKLANVLIKVKLIANRLIKKGTSPVSGNVIGNNWKFKSDYS